MIVQLGKLYQSEKGIWRYELIRDGEVRWASLHTRDENAAKVKYESIRLGIVRAFSQKEQMT